MSTESHCSKLSSGDRPKRPPSCSFSTSCHKMNNNNSDVVVEDEKELMKARDLVSPISPSFNHPNSEKVEGGRVEWASRAVGGSNCHANRCFMEIKNPNHEEKTTRRKSKYMPKTHLKEVSNCLTTSKEIASVLNHVWAHEDDNQQRPSATSSLITALKSELDRAKTQVDHMLKDQRFHGEEIEGVMKRFSEEKVAWKYRERARARSAITSMADEVEVQKKLRRQAQRLNNTLAKELARTNLSLSKAMKDLHRERRAKEILEQICDELAKGIGEERAELEELKKESKKVREEVEKEREMVALADAVREERVQMKLSEAKHEFEEKSAAIEKLRHELEAYFVSQAKDEEHDCSEEEDESDLHSIELNMDNNSKSYRWSFVHGSKRTSFQKDQIDGTKSVSGKIQWGGICFNGEFDGRKSHDTEFLQNEITHNNTTKSIKCLGDILFPGSPEDQTQVGKTEDELALSVQIHEAF